MEKIDLIKKAFEESLKDFLNKDRLYDNDLPINSVQKHFYEHPEDIIDLEIMLKKIIVMESFGKGK